MGKNKSKYISILFFSFAICVACQCIPSLDTEKDITPSQYAQVICVNCAPMFGKVKLTIGGIILHNSLSYDIEEGFKYLNVLPGVTNFVVSYKNDSVVYNGFANLVKGQLYTFFIIQLQRRVNGLLLNDSISNYSPTNSYFRFVNLALNSPSYLLFNLEQQYPLNFSLNFKNYTKFYTTYPEKYNITITDLERDSILFQIKNYEFKPGKGYTIVLRGDLKAEEPNYGCNVLILQHNFDDLIINRKYK
ncbi:MAG: hypothetical protein ACK42Z_10080 [Candidatus Kapaibacteriota bacterium]